MKYGTAFATLCPVAVGYSIGDDATPELLLASITNWPVGIAKPTAAAVYAQQGAMEKMFVLAQARAIRETALGRIGSIASRAARSGDTTGIAAACDVAAVSLLNITSITPVISATDGASTKAAIITEWRRIATNLTLSAQSAAKAFAGLDL